MKYDFIAIPDADVPQAVEPTFQHVLTTYAIETNETADVWRAVPDDRLDYKPHEKTTPIRTILAHQLLSAWLLRSVRRHRGAAGRGTAASGRNRRGRS